MTNVYIARLIKSVSLESQEHRSPLQERFLQWYKALPEISRQRPFAMQEFEAGLGTQGKYISAVLVNLGWQRKRKWTSKGHYHRYWLPPT